MIRITTAFALLFIVAMIGVIIVPGELAAQECNEKCAHFSDPITGEEVGHGCLAGDQGYDCEATIEECRISDCHPVIAFDESGIPVAVISGCTQEVRVTLIPRNAAGVILAPGETRWIRVARGAGLPAADGIEMLIQQGAVAYTHWWREPAPIEAMRAALRGSGAGVGE